MNTEYIVMTASAKMPSNSWGRYGKIAIVEVESGVIPKMISEHARGVVRIVELRDRLHMGGPRSAYQLALVDMERQCDALNNAKATA